MNRGGFLGAALCSAEPAYLLLLTGKGILILPLLPWNSVSALSISQYREGWHKQTKKKKRKDPTTQTQSVLTFGS